MHRRIATSLAFAAFALMVLGAPVDAAPAADYPPTGPPVVLSGHFDPGGPCTLNLGNAAPDTPQAGAIDGTIPVNDTADANGVLNYTCTTPDNFTLNAEHNIVLEGGATLTFCVNSAGDVADCSTLTVAGRELPRTGADHIGASVRVAAAAIGVGALLLFWRRRRLAGL